MATRTIDLEVYRKDKRHVFFNLVTTVRMTTQINNPNKW